MTLYSSSVKETAAACLKRLSFREKIGQMVQFNNGTLKFLRETMTDEQIAEKYPFGSCFSGDDVINLVKGSGSERRGLDVFRSALKVPLMIAGDLEKGTGGESLPDLIVLGATRDPDLAYRFGKVVGQRIRTCGFHWTFSPVADIVRNWRSPAIAGRALGSDPELVAGLASQIIRGLQDQGVCATAKHFPGDGIDFRNQHLGPALDDISREEWEATFGKVYRKVIAAGVRSIMAGHIGLTWADASCLPATLSEKLSTGLLRDELNFEGVLVSDALIMSGFVSFQDPRKRLIAAVNAGMDVLLWPEPEVFDVVERAVEAGDIPEKRIEESARRVLEMKAACGLLGNETVPEVRNPGEAYALTAKEIAEKGTVLVSDRNHFLPLDARKDKNILVVVADDRKDQTESDLRKDPRIVHIIQELESRGAELTVKANLNCLSIANAEAHGILYDAVLVLFPVQPLYSYLVSGFAREMIWMMSNFRHSKVIAVSLASPYVITENPNTPAAVINACSNAPASQRAAVRMIYGEIQGAAQPPQDLMLETRVQKSWADIHYRSI